MRYLAPLVLTALAMLSAASVEDPRRVAAELQRKYDADTLTAGMAFLSAMDLSAIPEPKLGADPRRSEQDQLAEVRQVNGLLSDLERWRNKAAKGDRESSDAIVRWMREMASPGGGRSVEAIQKYKKLQFASAR